MPSIVPSVSTTAGALFVGVLIPLLSSIIPIRRALSANLHDALDVSRGKTPGVLITFIDNRTKDLVPYLLFGSVAVTFGISIYYGLPMAMLKLNFGLLLTIFFAILMGLLLGLVLIAINLQSFLERVLMYILLFWETGAMKTLLRKNMIAHRKKNQLTAIIYALTLGCIIFLLTSANLQIETINQIDTIENADIIIKGKKGDVSELTTDGNEEEKEVGILTASMVDPVISKYSDSI